MRQIVASDIGGTHARFALAEIADGKVVAMGEPTTLKTAEHSSFDSAYKAFGETFGGALPDELSMAFAGPVGGEVLTLTNNPWVIRPALMRERLGIEHFTVVNDFGAVAHAVATLPEDHFRSICGPDRDLPAEGLITVIGPGTGLGAAALMRLAGHYHVIETEGGHVDFAPIDRLEDQILAKLRQALRRVSVERIASGRGLWNLYEALGAIEGKALTLNDEKAVWAAAIDGTDSLAVTALERLCMTLGSIAGDLALAHGANAVVIGGGVGLRLADVLGTSGFPDRFIAKGRFERLMSDMPVKLITYAQPGLYGAAAAFAREHQ